MHNSHEMHFPRLFSRQLPTCDKGCYDGKIMRSFMPRRRVELVYSPASTHLSRCRQRDARPQSIFRSSRAFEAATSRFFSHSPSLTQKVGYLTPLSPPGALWTAVSAGRRWRGALGSALCACHIPSARLGLEGAVVASSMVCFDVRNLRYRRWWSSPILLHLYFCRDVSSAVCFSNILFPVAQAANKERRLSCRSTSIHTSTQYSALRLH